MWTTARRLLLTGALVAGLGLPAAPAVAQQPDLESVPGLTTQPPPSLRDEPSPSPTPDEPDPTPTPSAIATPDTTAQSGGTDTRPTAAAGRGDLPNTGSDAQTLAFAGLSLLMLGASLRLQVVLRDGRV